MLWPNKLLPRATWLWETKNIEHNGADVIAFLKEEQIARVYLQINPHIKAESYHTFIKAAHLAGIDVHALDGAPHWVQESGQAEIQASMQWLADYQAGAQPDEKFQGIHLDVEPYLLPEWKNKKDQIIKNYQVIMNTWLQFAQNQKILIGVDIPFWYDEERIGQMSLFDWLYGAVDEITVMSYRNQVEGENGILAITSYEREMSKKVGKPLYMALETEPSQEGDHLFFESYPLLMQAVEHLQQHLMNHQGIAIHHYDRYRRLRNQADR
jgi:hypothetical protein